MYLTYAIVVDELRNYFELFVTPFSEDQQLPDPPVHVRLRFVTVEWLEIAFEFVANAERSDSKSLFESGHYFRSVRQALEHFVRTIQNESERLCELRRVVHFRGAKEMQMNSSVSFPRCLGNDRHEKTPTRT